VTFKRKDKTTQHLYEHPEFQRITQEFLKFVEERQINHKGFSLETSAAYRNWTFAETIDDSSTLKCGIQFVELPDNKSKIVTAMTDDLLDSNDAAKRDFAESIMKCQLECFHNPKVTVSMDCATDTDIDKVIETVKLLNSTGQLKDGALNIQIKLSESYTPPEKYKDFLASCKDIKSIEALLETVKEDKHTMRSK